MDFILISFKRFIYEANNNYKDNQESFRRNGKPAKTATRKLFISRVKKSFIQADAGIQLRDFVKLSASASYTLTCSSITPSSLAFPLAQNIILNVSGNSSFTLPQIGSDLALGISINFIKIAANGTIVTINPYSGNFISNSNTYTTTTTTTDANLLGANSNYTTLTIVKNSGTAYGWAELSNATKAADVAAKTYVNLDGTTSQTITGPKTFQKITSNGYYTGISATDYASTFIYSPSFTTPSLIGLNTIAAGSPVTYGSGSTSTPIGGILTSINIGKGIYILKLCITIIFLYQLKLFPINKYLFLI